MYKYIYIVNLNVYLMYIMYNNSGESESLKPA